MYDENTIRGDVLIGEIDIVSLLHVVIVNFSQEITLKFSLPSDNKGKILERKIHYYNYYIRTTCWTYYYNWSIISIKSIKWNEMVM